MSSFKVITKTPRFAKDSIASEDAELLVEALTSSLQKLNLKSVYGLLIHDVDNIFALNGSKLIKAMERLKDQGLVSKIGVSIYSSNQIKMALEYFNPDIVQLPLNVLDQRLIKDGTIARLSNLGVEIHARSAFLQGLLLMSTSTIPAYFDPWTPLLSKWHLFCRDESISPLQAALGFVCSIQEVSHAIVGVQNHSQLAEILDLSIGYPSLDFRQFSSDDQNLIDPCNWSLV